MYTYVYIYICTYLQIYTYTHTYIYMHIYIYLHIYTYIHVFICIFIWIQTPVKGRQGSSAGGSHDSRRLDLRYTDIYKCIYVYIYTYIHGFICIFIYTNTSTRKARRFCRRLAWLEKNGPQLPSIYTFTYIHMYMYIFKHQYKEGKAVLEKSRMTREEWTSASEYAFSFSFSSPRHTNTYTPQLVIIPF